MNANIAARLLERARIHPARTAIVATRNGRREAVTFAGLAARTMEFSQRLRQLGVGPGERVLLFVPMSVDLYVALLGILHAGAVAVFVDAWADRRRLEAAVAVAGPRAFVGTPRAHLLRLLSPAVRRIPVALVARAGLGAGDARAAGAGPGGPPAAELDGDALALVTFTTGTTGRPKGAARSHAFLWAQHEVLAAHRGLREGDVDMPTLPVFVLDNLANGIPTVLPAFDPRRPADIRPAAILEQMAAESVTTSTGSPAFYDRLIRHLAETGGRLPLRSFFTGGAPVSVAMAGAFAAACTDSQVFYGSTEAEPIASITSAELARRTAADPARGLCAGRPIPEIELRIVRPVDGPMVLGPGGWDEWMAEAGQAGEIVVCGSHVLRGYVADPEADTENKVRDGARVWHRTGDGGCVDEQGFLWLTGRVRHRVRRGDQTWWGLPVELRVIGVRGIGHAAYIGLPDRELGQRAVLCVETPRAGMTPRLERDLVAAASPAPVDELVAVDSIPRDPRHASKTDHDALRARLSRRRGELA